MSLDFQQISLKIKEIGAGARQHEEGLAKLRKHASHLLAHYAGRLDELRNQVERARQNDPNLRCALPFNERLDAYYPPAAYPERLTLLAADGSQVAPDRHASVQYGLVNVGAIVMELTSGKPPEISTDSRLLFAEELYTQAGMLTEEAIALRRDIAERKKLLELASKFPPPVVALTDGPVELWGAKGGGEDEYRHNLQVHLSILSQLQSKDVTVAGYVDKPGADLVVRLLEIAELSEDELKDVRIKHSLRGVTDRWLYSELLPGGHRSSVFGLQSSSRQHYTGSLGLHFFYLNVGDEKHPWLVRVEVPAWVADNESKLKLLHSVLLQQCGIMGARPYPYILHRAHEVAVVTYEERQQVEQMLAVELRRSGGVVEGESAKQSAKNLPGRTRSK